MCGPAHVLRAAILQFAVVGICHVGAIVFLVTQSWSMVLRLHPAPLAVCAWMCWQPNLLLYLGFGELLLLNLFVNSFSGYGRQVGKSRVW